MSDHLQPGGPGGSTSQQDYGAPNPGTSTTEFGPPGMQPGGMEDLDREVREAMAAMDSADLAELCGQVPGSTPTSLPTDSESVAAGAELIGTVVGFSDDEVFLELTAGHWLKNSEFRS